MKMRNRRRKHALDRVLQIRERIGRYDHELEPQGALPPRQLGGLKRQFVMASGIGSKLIEYANCAGRPLIDLARERAEAIAREEVRGVRHSMNLSGKPTSDDATRKLIGKRTEELLCGDWAVLFQDS